MLKSQQEEATDLRRKATKQGFEINVYVPLGLEEPKQQQRQKQNEQQDNKQPDDKQQDKEKVYELTEEFTGKTYEHEVFLREIIAQQPVEKNKHIAIIGEPGAGKTTLLSTIASFIKDNTQDLPICISLAKLQAKDIEEYLLKQWLPKAIRLAKPNIRVTPEEIEHQLIECFSKGGVWLLLDGVDEMGENSPVQALAKINREVTAYLRQARVVLTCRLNVWYAKVSNPLTGFDTYKTQEFTPEQIDDFIQQWFERAGNLSKGNKLQAKLKETKHKNIRRLLKNPLRLSLLCQTFNEDEKLAGTQAELYQKFTSYLYEWKSELFPHLYRSDDLKDELHCALSKLAFAGINTKAGFRLTKKLARQKMGEKLFQVACASFWLILVEKTTEIDEEVYAFFHPNFQEYFAALNVNDWHEFLKHVHHNPAQGTYRIFESQWREVILLWLGRTEENLKQQKQQFIDALVNFKDKCGQWNRKDIDKGFYEYRAYFLAAVGIAEFRAYSRADEIVAQIVKWSFGDSPKKHKWLTFYYLIQKEARVTLQQTDRTKAVAPLEELLKSKNLDEEIRIQAAESLGTIDPGNKDAIRALVEMLQSTRHYYTREKVIESLGIIGTDNENAIRALVELLQSTRHYYTREKVIESLGKIGIGNEIAITALVELLKSSTSPTVDYYDDYYTREREHYIRGKAIDSLERIGICHEKAIAALVELLQSPTVDNYTHRRAVLSLEKIGIGNEIAIAALVELLQSSTVDEDTRKEVIEILGKIGIGNEIAITALVELLQSSTVHYKTRNLAASNLEKIGKGNEKAIAVLEELLKSPNVFDYIRWQTAHILGTIHPGNEIAIAALVELLMDEDTYWQQAAFSLRTIGKDNEIAIAAFEKLLQSPTVDEYTCRFLAYSLGIIKQGSEIAIDTLEKLLQSPTVHDYNRRSAAWDNYIRNSDSIKAAYSLGIIKPRSEIAIAALEKLLQFPTVDDYTRIQAAESLGIIKPGSEIAIDTLVKMLQSPTVHDYNRKQAANSLEKIGIGNENVITALAQLLQSPAVDDFTCREVIAILRKICKGNENAIAALVQLLQSPAVDKDTLWEVIEILRKIGTGNENAIEALVQILESPVVDDLILREVISILGKIGTGNEIAIEALVKLLESPVVDNNTRREVIEILGKIGTGNENAIAALVELLQSKKVNNYNRKEVMESLNKILQNNSKHYFEVVKITLNYWYWEFISWSASYNLVWKITQNMPYSDFYQAWRDTHNILTSSLKFSKKSLNKAFYILAKIFFTIIPNFVFIVIVFFIGSLTIVVFLTRSLKKIFFTRRT